MNQAAMPLWKTVEQPLLSLSASHVELFSILALFLLSTMALVAPRSGRQWVRHVVQAASVAVFVFVVYSCLGVFGMIRNTIYGTELIGQVYTESFFWLSLPVTVMAFSISTGPFFCGWICPTGTFQEITSAAGEWVRGHWRRRTGSRGRKRGGLAGSLLLAVLFAGFLVVVFRLGATRRFYVEDSSLFWAAALVVLVWLVSRRLADDRAIRALRTASFFAILASALLHTAIISPMHFAFAQVDDPASMLSTAVLVVAALFVSRAWCRYLCPWGYLMGCLHRVSRLRVEATGACNGCGGCEDVCRVGAISNGRVDRNFCQLCMACVDHCPQRALELVDAWKKRGRADG